MITDSWMSDPDPHALFRLASAPSASVVLLGPAAADVLLQPEQPYASWTPGDGRWCYLVRHDASTIGRVPLLTESPTESVDNLREWRAWTGSPYSGTPGAAGCTHLRWTHGRRAGSTREPTWLDRFAVGTMWGTPDEGQLVMRATEPPPAGLYLHEYDANAAYLAAALAVELGRWTPQRRWRTPEAGAGWDPGLYAVELEPWTSPIPLPNPAGNVLTGTYELGTVRPRVVLAHPTLDLLSTLQEQGLYGGFRVVAARTSDRRSRVLRPWAENIRDGMYDGKVSDPVAATLKASYRECIGLMGRPGGRIYRPDWRAAVVALTRVNLWRRAWHIGTTTNRWPYAIDTDALAYLSPDPDPVASSPLRLGERKLGHFKVKRTMTRPAETK